MHVCVCVCVCVCACSTDPKWVDGVDAAAGVGRAVADLPRVGDIPHRQSPLQPHIPWPTSDKKELGMEVGIGIWTGHNVPRRPSGRLVIPESCRWLVNGPHRCTSSQRCLEHS